MDDIPNWVYFCCAGLLVIVLIVYDGMRKAWDEFEEWRKKK